jgi:hypothetical protein
MRETEPPRVQSLTGKRGNLGTDGACASEAPSGASAVDPIADQRVAAMGEMDPDLVGPTRGETAFDKRCRGLERALDSIASDRRFPPCRGDNRHFFSVYRAAANVARDLADGRRRYAPDESGVCAIDSSGSEVTGQSLMRGLGLGNDHQPARILIEAVNDSRAADPADAGQGAAAMAQQGVDEGAVRVSRSGMDNHARRLVDNDQMFILEADIERNRLRYRRRILNIRYNYDKILVAPNAQRGVANRPPALGDMAGFNQPFEPGARQLREMEGEHAIQPLPNV